MSGNYKCPFCNADRLSNTDEEDVEEMITRVEANDPGAMFMLAARYYHGLNGMLQDHAKAIELFTKSADLGCSEAHNQLGAIYHDGGALKKAKFHVETAAMAGHEGARHNLGVMEAESGNMERAPKHWNIAASAGHCSAMHNLQLSFELGRVTKESIDSTLAAYNSSCAEMRSEARDSSIRAIAKTINLKY